MNALTTFHGQIHMANGLVSLTDIWNNAGRTKQGNHPMAWCEQYQVVWHGDVDDVFVSAFEAVRYARAVDSDVMAKVIESELNINKPAMNPASLPFSQQAADSSRAMLLSAFKAAGIGSKHEFAKLTNHLYQTVLNQTTYGLHQTYECKERSVRKSLDNLSLLKVMTAEINLTSYIYAEQIKGYTQVYRKIKQIGPLVQSIFETNKH